MLETLTKIGGVTALAVGVFYLLYREIIRRNIFVSLSRTQTFAMFLTIAVLVWAVAMTALLFREGVLSSIAIGSGITVNQNAATK